jgi:hypothetical protein
MKRLLLNRGSNGRDGKVVYIAGFEGYSPISEYSLYSENSLSVAGPLVFPTLPLLPSLPLPNSVLFSF